MRIVIGDLPDWFPRVLHDCHFNVSNLAVSWCRTVFGKFRGKWGYRQDGTGHGMGIMRILVVEDEPLLAMLLEESLAELGHEVVGSAATVDQAMATIDSLGLDFALLDFTLADDATSAPVATRLIAEGIAFVYLTGHHSLPLGGDVPVAPLLTKPFTLDQLDEALRTARLAA